MSAPSPLGARLRHLWHTEIWRNAPGTSRASARWRMALRVVSITCSGLRDLKFAARAAALSYSSLLAFGPLIALTVLIAGFALGDRDPAVIAQTVNRVLTFIAPQIAHFDEAGTVEPSLRAAPPTAHRAPAPDAAETAAAPELVRLVNQFVASSRSGAAGVLGALALLGIVVMLFTNVENTFNDIWGVRRGRHWLTRLVYYWALVTLGAVLFFSSVTLLSAGAFVSVFHTLTAQLPWAEQLQRLFAWLLPLGSGLLLAGLLALFYRITPNTRVRWRAACLGGAVVTCLLFLNNYAAFLYFRNVVSTRSLYGSVALPIVLMAGMYVFWLIVLVGGQLTYAVQNVHYRSSQTAWHSLNQATRESLSLLVLLLIARRFRACEPAASVAQLSHHTRVPTQILNESLNRLCDLGLIAQLPPDDRADPTDYRFQPALPLSQLTLHRFRELFEHYGDAPSGGLLDSVDPILADYHARLATLHAAALGDRSLEQLIADLPAAGLPRAPQHHG